ncbi:MAG: hypothetical protein AAFR11_10690 [Pseudomonadota bacterium]
MAKLLPLIIVVVGVLAGAGVGFVLKPEDKAEAHEEAHDGDAAEAKPDKKNSDKGGRGGDKSKKKKSGHGEKETSGVEYLEFRRQFIVPVVRENGVKALVVLDLTLEVEPGTASDTYRYEPKLRAAFLETLFALSHSGLFSGELTESRVTTTIQSQLLGTAKTVVGDKAKHVLVLGVLRQDI